MYKLNKCLLVVIFFSTFLGQAFADCENLIGFYEKEEFFPLVYIGSSGVVAWAPEKVMKQRHVYALRNMKKINVVGQQHYFDPFMDESGLKYILSDVDNDFGYVVGCKNAAINVWDDKYKSDIWALIVKVASTEWGKNYADVVLKKDYISLVIGFSLDLISDLDEDKNIEIWLSYTTMYGSRGIIVYEKNEPSSGDWKEVISFCLMCD